MFVLFDSRKWFLKKLTEGIYGKKSEKNSEKKAR
jgi:hypothetical protein